MFLLVSRLLRALRLTRYTAVGLAVPRQVRGIPTFAEHVVAWAKIGVEGAELSTRLGYQSQAHRVAQEGLRAQVCFTKTARV